MYSYMQKCIDKNFKPVTKDDLIHKFSQLGIKRGDTLLVHASLSSLGYVVGGAEALYLALREVIGIEGTIVVPSQTVEISDPASWQYPPVPDEWHDVIRDAMPAYSKELSYSKAMGAFSQFIGILPDSIRSNHPMYSFTAIGEKASEIIGQDSLDFPFGDKSPLGRMYSISAKVLMIGTDFETNTSLHLAENRLNREVIHEKSKILTKDGEKWISLKNIELDIYDDYLEVQKNFMEQYTVNHISINDSNVYLFDMKECVDFAEHYYQLKE
ncbi:hypothetical protein HMPREF0446_00370 [Granulicatella elegans ATCC 700633]|uniref:Aminoglycoside N(3)-acetyltransferase n=1 Tax=Granulicatella elegans ATCC 700633 TaxID=626369 RepID=D0BK85_9LACT|nr:AAC(3) family N-acetyltransferase [Granulicatella elegans]EEW93488.2 hypothetical protein HMPREF0446_00370 [Granulicatella elegans ATCC 700633]